MNNFGSEFYDRNSSVSQFFVRNYPFSLRILVLSITKIVVVFFV